MNQFLLQQGHSKELQLFPHIAEFAIKKNNTIQLNSFPKGDRKMSAYLLYYGWQV